MPSPKKTEIMITHLDQLADKKRLNEKNPNQWKAVPYTTAKFAGVMLAGDGGPCPVPLKMRLARAGLYRVFLGLYSGFYPAELRVRLSNDLCCRRIVIPKKKQDTVYDISGAIFEIFWKEADLTGQSLFLESGFMGGRDVYYPSALAYIRLEPVAKINALERGITPYPFFITDDGHGIFRLFPHSRPEDLLERFETNVPDDRNYVQGLIWGNGDADTCNYPTRIGNAWPVGDSGGYYGHNFYSNTRLWRKKGWDSMEVMRKYAARRNWEFQVYIRMQAFAAPFPFDRLIHSNFFHRHPQYHCLDRKGRRIGRLSYAYPAVQEHMLELIAEILNYKPDGICLCLIRGVPLVLYEPLMVAGFKKEYGVAPQHLAETDGRWQAYQATIITAFIRKAKRLLKPHQRLSVIVPGRQHDCERWGLDVATWVKEGLVDDVFPFGQYFDEREVHRFDVRSLDFKYFNTLANRDKIRLVPMAGLGSAAKLRRMRLYLEQGADGYAAWDGVCGDQHIAVNMIARNSVKAIKPASFSPKKVQLLSISGFRHDRYHHFEVT